MISSSNRVIKNNESVRVTKFNPLHAALYGDGDGSVTVKFPEIGALEKQLEEEEDANNPELSEGKREALRILEEAKKEAGLIIEAAKEEAEKLRKEASERGYEEGHDQPSFDKQFVRDWLKANPDSDYNLPEDVIDKTIEKYKEAYKLLTGKDLEA